MKLIKQQKWNEEDAKTLKEENRWVVQITVKQIDMSNFFFLVPDTQKMDSFKF